MIIECNEGQARMIAHFAAKLSGVVMAPEQVPLDRAGTQAGITLKNMGGCAINFYLRRLTNVRWELSDDEPVVEKQAWARLCPSYMELIALVPGIRVVSIGEVKPKVSPIAPVAEPSLTNQKIDSVNASIDSNVGSAPVQSSKEVTAAPSSGEVDASLNNELTLHPNDSNAGTDPKVAEPSSIVDHTPIVPPEIVHEEVHESCPLVESSVVSVPSVHVPAESIEKMREESAAKAKPKKPRGKGGKTVTKPKGKKK